MAMPARPVAVTMGDPAGCGPDITRAAWAALRTNLDHPFAVLGPPSVYRSSGPVEQIKQLGDAAAVFPDALPVLDLGIAMPPVTIGQPDTGLAPAIIASIEHAVTLVRSGEASAIVTNPISKTVLYKAGFTHPGHTEFLAALCKGTDTSAPKPVMMLVGGGLRVALATIHMPLKDVPNILNQEMLIEIGEIVATALKHDFGLPAPRLAFTGLNPHAGEDGSLGREEIEIINPAAETLRKRGIDIANARPGDTVFHEALSGQFDAVIAMTHDQGLIPVKTLDIWGGVNTTLGLPIIRTSPDHGTAYDAAAAGTARPDSLIAAIKQAQNMAQHRNGPHG